MARTGFLLLYHGVNRDEPTMVPAADEAACADRLRVALCDDVNCRAHRPMLGARHSHIPVGKFPKRAEEYPTDDPDVAGHHFREYRCGEVIIVDHFSPPRRRRSVVIYYKRGKITAARRPRG